MSLALLAGMRFDNNRAVPRPSYLIRKHRAISDRRGPLI
jgi:hypothetical protein